MRKYNSHINDTPPSLLHYCTKQTICKNLVDTFSITISGKFKNLYSIEELIKEY